MYGNGILWPDGDRQEAIRSLTVAHKVTASMEMREKSFKIAVELPNLPISGSQTRWRSAPTPRSLALALSSILSVST